MGGVQQQSSDACRKVNDDYCRRHRWSGTRSSPKPPHHLGHTSSRIGTGKLNNHHQPRRSPLTRKHIEPSEPTAPHRPSVVKHHDKAADLPIADRKQDHQTQHKPPHLADKAKRSTARDQEPPWFRVATMHQTHRRVPDLLRQIRAPR